MLPHRPTPEFFQSSQKTTPEADAKGATKVLTPSQVLVEELLRRSLILNEEWEALPAEVTNALKQEKHREQLLLHLVTHKLLTSYQAERIEAGQWGGLILGNYRILGKLGSGGMGVVLQAEHLLMRHLVAIKILPNPYDDIQALPRFLAEIRHVTALHHPNIVAALDAGRTLPTEWENPNWYYLVMEYVPGTNLEHYVRNLGPLTIAKACDLICQVASGVAEAHKHELLHRDIKPSNIMVTPEGQAKLTDFGLARTFQDRHLTKPGTVLGTIDYIAPEQASDSTAIDARADLFSLGATLYWCLTAQAPFPPSGSLIQDLARRQTQAAPSLRSLRLDAPLELSAVVSRMMALRPEDRYPSAQAIIQALLPYLQPSSSPRLLQSTSASVVGIAPPEGHAPGRERKVLIVDDSPTQRTLTRFILESEGIDCSEVGDGPAALNEVHGGGYDLVLLDIQLPGMGGKEILQALRTQPPCPNLKVMMLSGEVDVDAMAGLLAAGADDYLQKSASVPQLIARVKAALAHKEAQDRSDFLNCQLLALNAELERNLSASSGDMVHARNGLILALAELGELRTHHGAAHLARLQRFVQLLASEAARVSAFAGQIDAAFIDMLQACAPLHDIGQVALPDHILQKAGKLDQEERLILQSHTTIGADILQGIARRHRSALGFLQMAIDISRHHHESFDGTGYPDRLAGAEIPLSARLVTVADVYDALRSRRPQRPPLAHLLAVELMTSGMPTHFDPHLLALFQQHADHFEAIYQEAPDQG